MSIMSEQTNAGGTVSITITTSIDLLQGWNGKFLLPSGSRFLRLVPEIFLPLFEKLLKDAFPTCLVVSNSLPM